MWEIIFEPQKIDWLKTLYGRTYLFIHLVIPSFLHIKTLSSRFRKLELKMSFAPITPSGMHPKTEKKNNVSLLQNRTIQTLTTPIYDRVSLGSRESNFWKSKSSFCTGNQTSWHLFAIDTALKISWAADHLFSLQCIKRNKWKWVLWCIKNQTIANLDSPFSRTF